MAREMTQQLLDFQSRWNIDVPIQEISTHLLLAEDTGSSHGSKDFLSKAAFANNKCEIRIFLKGIF